MQRPCSPRPAPPCLAFDPYELNVMIANKSTAAAILNLTEFKDPGVAVNFQLKGEIPTPCTVAGG